MFREVECVSFRSAAITPGNSLNMGAYELSCEEITAECITTFHDLGYGYMNIYDLLRQRMVPCNIFFSLASRTSSFLRHDA
jgi:hypothetical protein